MKIPCRGCGTLLDLSATGCQICMRGRSPQEIAGDARRLKEAERRRRLLPWKIIGLLALLGAGGWLSARYREPLARLHTAARTRISGAFEKLQDPNYYAPREDPPPPPAPDPASTQAAPGTPQPRTPGYAPAAPPHGVVNPNQATPAQPPPVREPTWELPPAPGEALPGHWLVRGFVYDLATAKPLAEVELSFEAVDGGYYRATARTNEDGYYLARLPSRRNYRTMARSRGYRTFPLEDGDPPYRAMNAAARRQAVKEALEYSSDAATLGWNENYEEVRQDFALVPEPRPAR